MGYSTLMNGAGLLTLALLLMYVPGAIAQGACLEIFTRKSHTFHVQETDYFCGPAVLQAALAKQNIFLSQAELAHLAKTTPALGTSPENMARTLAMYGLKAEIKIITSAEYLRQLLVKNETVIALIRSEGDAHWVIVDAAVAQKFRLMDPWVYYQSLRIVSEATLLEMWQSAPFDNKIYDRLAVVVSL